MAKAYNGRRSGFDPFFEEVLSKGFSAAFFEDLPSRLDDFFEEPPSRLESSFIISLPFLRLFIVTKRTF